MYPNFTHCVEAQMGEQEIRTMEDLISSSFSAEGMLSMSGIAVFRADWSLLRTRPSFKILYIPAAMENAVVSVPAISTFIPSEIASSSDISVRASKMTGCSGLAVRDLYACKESALHPQYEVRA